MIKQTLKKAERLQGSSMGRLKIGAKMLLRRDLDGVEYLQLDHMRVELLMLQLKAAREEGRKGPLLDKLHSELSAHMHAEEQEFYPLFKSNSELRQQILEAYEEHKQIRNLLEELRGSKKKKDVFAAKLRVLTENFRHHVNEEEKELFPKVRSIMEKSTLHDLAGKLRRAKEQSQRAKAA